MLPKQDRPACEIHKTRELYWERDMVSHSRFINKETGLFEEKYVEERVCPVCESDYSRLLFIKTGGTHVQCNSCEMIYLNPVFKDEALILFYQENHTGQSEMVDDDLEFYNAIYNKGLDLVRKSNPTINKVLDYGCSGGGFLDVASKAGIDSCFGMELNKIEADISKKKGYNIHNGLLHDNPFSDKFDLITLWDVFEHIKDGKAYLNAFREILSDNGLLFLQVPNAMSLAARVMQEHSNVYDGLEHVNLYSPETLKLVAEKTGFKVVQMQTVIPEMNVLNNYLNYENGYTGNRDATNNLLGLISESDLHKHLLGYKVQVVLQKNKNFM